MALNSRGSIDPRWLTHNMPVGYGLNLATVEIYRQDSAAQDYDANTNTWSGTPTTLYTGPARIQPLTNPAEAASDYNPTFVKNVRVQIPYNKNTVAGATEPVPDFRPADKLIVTAADYNETLTKFIYSVVDVLNSSNAWERTLLCKVDTELDPTES